VFRRKKKHRHDREVVEGSPDDLFAGLAQSLVGIQAMRAAAERGPATVGGTIETLVISKAHGVQWVSRLPGLPLEPTF